MKKKEITDRIVAHAANLNSVAYTAKGAHRYIMKQQRHPFLPSGWGISYPQKKAVYLAERTTEREAKHKAVIQLDPDTASRISAEQKNKHPRRQNWYAARPSLENSEESWTQVNQYRGSRYISYDYIPMATCWAVVRGKLGLEFHFKNQVTFLQPPNGYKWEKRHWEIRLVSKSTSDKDYHPHAADLLKYSKAGIRKKLLELYATRQAHKRSLSAKEKFLKQTKEKQLKSIRRAEKEGAMICYLDSIRAGNCQAGTMSFADRHGLSKEEHYKPSQLLKIANGDASRVVLAVAVGLKRHHTEIRQGYCLLENHKEF
jgi:hypothetical protein